MTQSLFDGQHATASHDLSAAAWQAWRAYGALNREESWRWTPLKALRAQTWRFSGADYQLSVPEGVDETFVRGADPAWLKLEDAPFAALNIALLDDTLQITIADGFVSDEPLALNLSAYQRTMQCARIKLRVGAGAKVALWVDMNVGARSGQCPLLQIDVAAGAQCDLALWLNGAQDSVQLSNVLVHQQAQAVVRVNALLHSGALARLDVNAWLHGEGGHFAFGGLQCLDGEAVGDYHVTVRHLAAHCTSEQVVRGALDDAAFALFDGMIYVAHGAQKTDAKQDSRYILQSTEAKSHSVPRLEIYADDVQCAHGSTVGFLDPEALFYLQSRGISKTAAEKMLILSFLHEAVVLEHATIAEMMHAAISDLWLGSDDE